MLKPESPWNNERIERLKDLWSAGLSAAQIASALGAGVSRSSVLGKVFRLGLSALRPDTPRRLKRPRSNDRDGGIGALSHSEQRKRDKLELPRRPLPADAALAIEPLHLAFAELEESHCRWPYGDGPFTFCGLLRAGDRAYCRHHERIAWRGSAAKRKGGFRLSVARKSSRRKAA